MQSKVEVKGIRDGILITLGEGSWEELQEELLKYLDNQAAFLQGARLAIDVGNHILKAVELGQLRNEISGRQMTLWAILSTSGTTETTAQTLGVATRLSKPRPELTNARINTTLNEGEPATVLFRTLRSGYSLHKQGHIVIIGDVNPGAEVVATGNVVVWGRLRGLVHAGANGDDHAIVCALDLSPTQLRIAGRIAITPEHKGKPQPEIARLVDGKVLAEIWDPKKSKGMDL
jgi:septum site-determining protein MinC